MVFEGLTFNYTSLFTIVGIYYLFIHDIDNYIERLIWMVIVGLVVGAVIGPVMIFENTALLES